MRRTVLFFVLLAALLFGSSSAFEAAGMQLEPRVRDRNQPAAGIRAQAPGTVDVLVLGDSESYTSISPLDLWREKGITSYVCGQSGQRIAESYYMLKQALKTQRPKLVLLETNAVFTFSSDTEELQRAVGEFGAYYLPVFRYHNLWKRAVSGLGRKPRFDLKGFWIRTGVRPYTGGTYMKQTKDTEPIRPLVFHYLEKIRKLCERRGIPLLLMTVPSPRNHTWEKHNTMAEYAKKKGLSYLDLNLETEALEIDWQTDSLDAGEHLNFSGAQKVTRYMAKYLERYALADHRAEEAYADWEKDAKRYRAYVEQKTREQRAAE